MMSSTTYQATARTHGRLLCVTVAGLLLTAPAFSQSSTQDLSHAPSVYLQGGRAEHNTDAVTLGLTLPWRSWTMPLWGGRLRGHWDLYVSRWDFKSAASHGDTWLLGVTPTLRLRPRDGHSAWFWEAGIGATMANRRYQPMDRKAFSTRFNFASHISLGINLDPQRRHELLLSLEHVSNAGIKKPNPGIEFLQLRYALHF